VATTTAEEGATPARGAALAPGTAKETAPANTAASMTTAATTAAAEGGGSDPCPLRGGARAATTTAARAKAADADDAFLVFPLLP